MTVIQQRESLRLQLGNQQDYQFVLYDKSGHQQCEFCVCVDLSAVGAQFVLDREIPLYTPLVLKVMRRDILLETLPVTVMRSNSELNDEDRFYCSIRFDRPFEHYDRFVEDLLRSTQAA